MLSPLVLASYPPLAVSARGNERVSLAPEVSLSKNSQTMSLLEGYLNTNPTGVGGPELAIVDGVALVHEGDGATAFVDASQSGGQISTYVVRDGDTLSSIANMFDVSINTITWANNIKNSTIQPGQELVILPISGVRHTVKSGETVKSITNKYNAELEDVLAYNGISADAKIAAGDVIIIPNGTISTSSSSKSKSGSASKSTSSSGTKNVASGYYIRPLVGGVKSQGIHGYNAVDLAAPIGTTLRAAASGKVIVAAQGGYNGGYGSYVVISHPNGTQTLYGHMSRVDVSVGEQVVQGETIGAVGSTGHSTGPHVHFEVRGAKNPF
jgi:murein DD-endopeptidase MepM/ murein hydrolase activator NlpD